MVKGILSTKEAAEVFGISPDVLKDRANSKEFKYGIHYIDIRAIGSVKNFYLWNTESILKYWQTSPEYRSSLKQKWALPNKTLSTKEAADLFSISADVLKDRVDNKEFQHGLHYLDIRGIGSVKTFYLWNIESILKYWQTPPEYRSNNNSDQRSSRRTLKAVS